VARAVKETATAVKASAMAKFAHQLRGWRGKRGWSQAELAGQLGYSDALVSQVERERKPPSAEFAARCDDVFDTPATFTDLQELVAREAWPSYFAPVVTGLMTSMNLIRAAALSPRESRQYIANIRDETA
jgi:transcriptional regulator with XRE-family HTH domain